MYITTNALVLRETKYKEADKMLTVLTEGEGKLTVKARGAYRKNSGLGAATQLLSYSEMVLFGNRGRWTVNEAETIEQFIGLRGDIAALSLGSYFTEMLDTVSDEDSPNPEILRLGLNSLYALSRQLYPPEHIKAVFELRLMCLSGFEPLIDACAVCGLPEPEAALFNLNAGILHCRACPSGSTGISMPLSGKTLEAMRYITSANEKRIFSFMADDDTISKLGDICEAYVPAQLDRGFHSLGYWKAVRQD